MGALENRVRGTAPESASTGPITREELQLASRNHAAPLESLRWPITPPGMHYLLVHFDVPQLDPFDWRLSVGGAVGIRLKLTLGELMVRPSRTITVTMECAGNGRSRLDPRPISQPWDLGAFGTAEWTGTPLAPLLAEAELADDAVELVFTGADQGVQGGVAQHYQRSLSIDDALGNDVLLAYEMNGRPLPPAHGFPLRLLVPGWYGMASVKWLRSIEAVRTPFLGYQQAIAYRYQHDDGDPGTPVQRIRVRSLLAPPGVPDFLTRNRLLEAGPVMLRGRAWSGSAPVARVDVAVDGGWARAQLEPSIGPRAWHGFSFPWVATPGVHSLACRAWDASGASQPLEPEWNAQGMGNTAVQRFDVEVVAAGSLG
ncbi:sulfite oxidase [Arthrobacter sp. 35W]|uniref:sulfite oxidase n=1 Tax=Arthrobacter sp. 35W TaxID=1132441 RepID=UPI00047DC4D4|nr:sulfite oxidase [Arthrobacter sp. 35W]